ncbi:MAG: hypothetical protein LBF12_03830 [Christensenellaceae bacterium]|jgi:hypothetical protein|nr:hypothetical protein [Christensenellaceae bacterium]
MEEFDDTTADRLSEEWIKSITKEEHKQLAAVILYAMEFRPLEEIKSLLGYGPSEICEAMKIWKGYFDSEEFEEDLDKEHKSEFSYVKREYKRTIGHFRDGYNNLILELESKQTNNL